MKISNAKVSHSESSHNCDFRYRQVIVANDISSPPSLLSLGLFTRDVYSKKELSSLILVELTDGSMG